MPYHYTKITDHLSHIDKSTRPTFIIDRLSAYVFFNKAMAVSEWFASIGSTMENPEKILQMLLLQPDRKDQLTQTDASYILHLCPQNALESWIKSIKEIDAEDWDEIYDTWVENFTQTQDNDADNSDDSSDDSSDDDEDEDEENDDDDAISDDDYLSDYSMPPLEEVDEEEIIYERVVLPWWNEDRAGLLRV
jgi:phosphopantothenoylcysteine synthetase/decarboxylase